jgi:creatinine amidohydrolase
VRLGPLASAELRESGGLHLLVPLGATEQHGPHLPLETDSLIADRIACLVAAGRSDVIVAPVLPYGSSGEHSGFPGTLSVGQAVLEEAVVELVRSADAFGDVVLIAWHGGNAAPVGRAVARLRVEGRLVRVWEPRVADGDAHAGRVETSVMLALEPSLVGSERPVGAVQPMASLLPRLRSHGVRSVASNGVLGDARGASAEEGERLLAQFVAEIGAMLA